MFDAIPAYLGGKRGILSQIFRELARHIDPSKWKQSTFVDGFVGGGSVSIYAKAQFASGNDLSDRSALIARAVLANNSRRLTYADGLLLLDGADSATEYAQRFASDWFIPETARFLDRALAYADTVADAQRADLLRVLVWRVILGARPSSGTFTSRNLVDRAMTGDLKTSGTVGARFAFRPPNINDLSHMIDQTNRGVFRGEYAFTQGDALVESKKWNADVVYLDPPYAGDSGYEEHYRVADCVMAQRDLGKGDGVSPFTDKSKAGGAIETLVGNVAKAGAKVVLLNNSDAAISRERLLAIVSEHFEAREVPIHHTHTAASSHGKDGTESGASEVFIVGSNL
jgi:adenine-specific DNA methylase